MRHCAFSGTGDCGQRIPDAHRQRTLRVFSGAIPNDISAPASILGFTFTPPNTVHGCTASRPTHTDPTTFPSTTSAQHGRRQRTWQVDYILNERNTLISSISLATIPGPFGCEVNCRRNGSPIHTRAQFLAEWTFGQARWSTKRSDTTAFTTDLDQTTTTQHQPLRSEHRSHQPSYGAAAHQTFFPFYISAGTGRLNWPKCRDRHPSVIGSQFSYTVEHAIKFVENFIATRYWRAYAAARQNQVHREFRRSHSSGSRTSSRPPTNALC